MKTGKSIILAAAIDILLAATGPWAAPPTGLDGVSLGEKFVCWLKWVRYDFCNECYERCMKEYGG